LHNAQFSAQAQECPLARPPQPPCGAFRAGKLELDLHGI